MERVIRVVLISQQDEKMNLKISEETDRSTVWLRGEESFSSEESERKYKMSKKELVEIVKGVMNIESLYWDFEELFFNKLVGGTLGEIDPSLMGLCEEYAEMKSKYN